MPTIVAIGPDGVQPGVAPQMGWRSSLKSRLRRLGSNTLQIIGTGVRIISEIAIFTGGMAYVMAPPLRKMWGALEDKNILYDVSASGDVYLHIAPQSNLSLPFNTTIPSEDHLTLNDVPISNAKVTFAMPYPEGIFVASILLLSLGSSGMFISHFLEKYGAYLQRSDDPTQYSDELVPTAQKLKTPLSGLKLLLLIGSRGTALYATATFNLMSALGNVSGIMNNFSILSRQNVQYNSPQNNTLIQSILLAFNIRTVVGLDELRQAAIKGSQDINDYYTPLAYLCAVISLVLGFAELKTSQRLDRYKEILQRHRHYLEKEQNQRISSASSVGSDVSNLEPIEAKIPGNDLLSEVDSSAGLSPLAQQSAVSVELVEVVTVKDSDQTSRAVSSSESSLRVSIPKSLSLFGGSVPQALSDHCSADHSIVQEQRPAQ